MYFVKFSDALREKFMNCEDRGLRGFHEWVIRWRLTQMPYNWTCDSTRHDSVYSVQAEATPTNLCYPRDPW